MQYLGLLMSSSMSRELAFEIVNHPNQATLWLKLVTPVLVGA